MIPLKTARIAAFCTFTSLFVAAFFTARQELNADMAIVSSVAIIVFALPAYAGVLWALGRRNGLILLAILGMYALAVETSALQTGFPYGSFVYRDLLGGKLFDVTPWTVAFAYPPILLFAYWLARQINVVKSYLATALATAFIAMTCDLVLDPAAVGLGFWYWPGGGFFYDVPLVNFAGWILSSAVGAAIVHYFLLTARTLPKLLPVSGLVIIFFWTSVNFWLGQAIPVILGLVIIYICIKLLTQNMKRNIHAKT